MTSRLNPYLSFADDAREAMEYYADVFGGTLTISTFGDYGAHDSPDADKVMHAQLETENGLTLMASDTPAGMPHDSGSAVAISISGSDADELQRYWGRLSEGGKVLVPLEKQMWGDEFGMCVDRFGIRWMINIGQPAG